MNPLSGTVRVRAARTTAVLAVLLSLTACTYSSGQKAVYLDTRSTASLEVPPELAKPRGDGALTLPERISVREAAAEAAALEGTVRVVRDGATRWLEVDVPRERLWSRLIAFWEAEGFDVVPQPELGILDTDWLENRAGLPRGLLGRLYSADIMDKYRVRVEQGREPGTSELYLTHRGVREEAFEGIGTQVTTVWQWRPSDPELEAEMLLRLMRFLGLPEKAAAGFGQAGERLAEAGDESLRLSAPMEGAWRRVGLALDRLGAEFERRDVAGRVYEVRVQVPTEARYSEPDAEDAGRYRVELRAAGAQTRVQVRALEGDGAQRLLGALAERLG